MSLQALTMTEHAPIKRAALMIPAALLDALIAAREYGVVDDEDAKDRREELRRLWGRETLDVITAGALTAATPVIRNALTRSTAEPDSPWSSIAWDRADGHIRALVELGLTDQQIIKEATA